jgi:hypothetical protein
MSLLLGQVPVPAQDLAQRCCVLRSLVQHDPHCSSCQAAAASAAAAVVVLVRQRYLTVLLQQLLQGWVLGLALAQPY